MIAQRMNFLNTRSMQNLQLANKNDIASQEKDEQSILNLNKQIKSQ
jgi:hypothetical protein